jgi:cysteinyl-tRNA synthetase
MATWGDSQNFLADAEIQTALIEDLDTPRAVLRLRAIEKDLSISPERKREIFNFADQVFALDLSRKVEVKPLSKEQMDLVQSRANARADKNWAESDRLRDVLAAEGIAVSDGPQGQSWNWIS